jgi:hypothetical protein
MDATLYTGNGTSISVVNAGGFSPDFVWIKSRSNTYTNNLYNTVTGIYQRLETNNTNAESGNFETLTSFNSNGFSYGNSVIGNANASTYVAWQWDAGSSTVTNTTGTISSQVRANPTAGFSIVTYTGTGSSGTVGHGLGVAPKMVIVKCRSTARSWVVYNSVLGNTKYLLLQTTDAEATLSTVWNNTTPTSSVFSIGTEGGVNGSARTYVAYCWAAIPGYSAFTSYTGNGSANGVFVYLGFRPKFVMVKRTNTTGEWLINDSSRDTYNPEILYLQPNLSSAEGTLNPSLDFLSNGFKFRTTNANYNASGGTYIVMAYAENPFKNSNAR